MIAKFQLAADLEIQVSDQQANGFVVLSVIQGVDYGQNSSPQDPPQRREDFPMHKSAARAIASAMMGCAAQLD